MDGGSVGPHRNATINTDVAAEHPMADRDGGGATVSFDEVRAGSGAAAPGTVKITVS